MNVSAFVILAQLSQSITVTVTAARTETRVADTPASVVVLSKETLAATPAPTLDDALRQVAGFTLFRRAGSRVANPTTQGVSLRGVGASGASRALVLDDGVPLNDPFGGWVYWGRVPRTAVERVEVLRGGASDLYGSSAMGGVIQFIRRRAEGVTVDASAGSQRTATTSFFAGMPYLNIAADLLTTAGYVLVRPEERGPVDVAADSRHAGVDATARRGEAFVRGSYYRESRNNGTPLQENDTTNRQLAGGTDFLAGALALRAYGSDQDYFQTFSTIAADRASERLTIEQRVPSRGAGANAQWTHALGGRQVLIAGTDLRYAAGTSDELRGATRVVAGGSQRTAAVYVEDLVSITPALTLTAGLRGDWWHNEGGATETQANPRLSLLWKNLSASAYTAFRAPTLNELYRGFRVGNINTLPNANLRAENLTGFELGARARHVRATLFWTSLTDTIANVTIGPNTRQRQNLGRTRSVGAELDGEWRLGRDWSTSLGYLFADATVRDGALRDKRLPQVPRHQATAQVSWKSIALQARWSTSQFDDDRNELRLRSYFAADAFASHPIGHGLDVTFAAENLLNTDVEVSASPVITLGQPRAFRVGLRYAWPGASRSSPMASSPSSPPG
jgi:outer membrane receptor protein involved in Fe transport